DPPAGAGLRPGQGLPHPSGRHPRPRAGHPRRPAVTGRAKGCEGVAKGFAKGSAKALTSKTKGSKGPSYTHTYKGEGRNGAPYARGGAKNTLDPFDPQTNPFAHPFATSSATPSQ